MVKRMPLLYFRTSLQLISLFSEKPETGCSKVETVYHSRAISVLRPMDDILMSDDPTRGNVGKHIVVAVQESRTNLRAVPTPDIVVRFA